MSNMTDITEIPAEQTIVEGAPESAKEQITEDKIKNDICYLGEPTQDDIMILGIPITKKTIEEMQKKGLTEEEAKEAMLAVVGHVRVLYKMAYYKMPKDKRETIEFRRGIIDILMKGLLGKVVIENIFGRFTIENFKKRLSHVVARFRKQEVQKIAEVASHNEADVIRGAKMFLKREGRL